jgi:carbon storage regulator
MAFLVLGRKKHETIYVGNDIKIVVFETSPGKTTLGIQAPKGTPILRGELLHKLQHPVTSIETASTSATNVA